MISTHTLFFFPFYNFDFNNSLAITSFTSSTGNSCSSFPVQYLSCSSPW